MTAHPTPAERLLAMLADEHAFEGLPAEEIRADLDAVGVDPSRCIAVARALAGGMGSPGGRLLGAIDMAEDEADEIARLESADIDAVRAQIPGASAAAIAAEARRQAGGDSNIVAMKPHRRGRILRWGGPFAGIAASVLLVVVVGVQLAGPERQPVSDDIDSYMAAPRDVSPAEPAYRLDEAPQPSSQYAIPEAEKRKRSAEQDSGQDAKGIADQLANQQRSEMEAPAAPAPSAGIVGNLNEERALADKDARDLLRQQGAGAEPLAGMEGFAAEPGIVEAPVAGKPDSDAGGLRGGRAAAATIAAMVIVDTSQVPLAVQSQALPQPDLAARIDEARRLAGSRPVIALYRVAGPAGQQDFAQVPLELAMTQQMPAPIPLTLLLGPAAFEYDFLALPER